MMRTSDDEQIGRRHVRRAVAVLLCALTAMPVMAALSGPERKSAAAIDDQQPWAIDFLEQIVNVNSGTHNLPGVMRVGALLRPQFEFLGFTVVWKPMETTGRAGHLIATHQGRPGAKRLLLIGHMDTVFEPDSPFQKFVRKGDFANGPGASDDKGGVVVMLAALRAMRTAGALRNANIEVVLTGDEEDAGTPLNISRGDLIAAGKRADIALDFEGLVVLDGMDMGSIARRSFGGYVITTHGVAAHSSGIFSPGVGDGAIFELARIICAFRAELPEPNLTFNIGVIAGGASAAFNSDATGASASGKTNITPSIAMANGDFRALSVEQAERVRKKMQAIVARSSAQTTADIVFGENYPPMAPNTGNRALLAQLNGVNADLGLPLMPELDPLMRGAGDISFVAQDVDGLVGLGTVSSGDHTAQETVDLRSINRQGKRAVLLMSRISRESRHAK